MNYYFRSKMVTNPDVFPYIKGIHLKLLPIRTTSNEMQTIITNIVDRILASKKHDPKADTTALEREIDRLVYRLYDLTPEEIAIVEAVS
jgi:hypothetical protein